MNNPGWQCPVCNRVYAPFVRECEYCNKKADDKPTFVPLYPPQSPSIFPYGIPPVTCTVDGTGIGALPSSTPQI